MPNEVRSTKDLLEEGFWSVELRRLLKILLPLIEDAAMDSAELSAKSLIEIGLGVDFTLVNQAVEKWASSYTFDLVKGITETSRGFLQESLGTWIESGARLGDLISQLEPLFGSVRANMIGVTETTRSFAHGNIEVWKTVDSVVGMRFMTAEDELVCQELSDGQPGCSDLSGQVFELDDHFHTPPIHVNCRCYLQPVMSES